MERLRLLVEGGQQQNPCAATTRLRLSRRGISQAEDRGGIPSAITQKCRFQPTRIRVDPVFTPTVGQDKAKRSAIQHLLHTFFNGSAEQAVATLLDDSTADLSTEELNRLAKLIDKARTKGN